MKKNTANQQAPINVNITIYKIDNNGIPIQDL